MPSFILFFICLLNISVLMLLMINCYLLAYFYIGGLAPICVLIIRNDIEGKYAQLVGPVMTKFTIALREIGTYKEVLRSQVNIVLVLFS